MNTLVNFEIAKLLADIGFDEPCSHYYILNFQNFKADGILHKCGLPDGEEHKTVFQFVKRKNQFHIANAPTIADTIMWLYDKHGIWIEIRKSYIGGFVPVVKHPRIELNNYGSPTEAYLAAIEYTLNNLI